MGDTYKCFRTWRRRGISAVSALVALACAAPSLANWEKTYGGPKDDVPLAIAPASDGGRLVVGYTESAGKGKADVWLLRLDKTGELLWEKTLGGPEADTADDVRALPNGTFIIAGSTRSKGAGETDAWAILVDDKGEVVWEKTFGGKDYDAFESVEVAKDGGFLFAGYNRSKVAGKQDAWFVLTDAKGEITWDKTFGGDKDDYIKRVIQSADGGFVAAGYQIGRRSTVGNAWCLKIGADGSAGWERAFPGDKHDWFSSIAPAGEGFILAGYTESNGAGKADARAVLIDAKGAPVWDRTYGGPEMDGANAVVALPAGGPAAYAMAGTTRSGTDKIGDAWAVWLDASGKQIAETTFGGKNIDTAHALAAVDGGKLIFAGANTSASAGGSDGWIVEFAFGAPAAKTGGLAQTLTDTRWSWIWLVIGLAALILIGAVVGARIGRRGGPSKLEFEKKETSKGDNDAPAVAVASSAPTGNMKVRREHTKQLSEPVGSDAAKKAQAGLDQLFEEVDSGARVLGPGLSIPLAEDIDEPGHWVLLGYDEDGSSIQFRFGPMMLAKAGDGLVLGRDPDLCHLSVLNSSVSRRHLRFTLQDGVLEAEDLNSTNGTYLDGRRLRPLEPVRLRHGASLILGDFFLRYVVDR